MKNGTWKLISPLPVAAASPLQVASPMQETPPLPAGGRRSGPGERWLLELGEVEFSIPGKMGAGAAPEAVVKVSVEDDDETAFFTKPLRPGMKNKLHQTFDIEVHPSVSSDEDESAGGGHHHETVPHVRIELFALDDNPADDQDAEDLAFSVVALNKGQRSKSGPSPTKTLQRLVLKDYEGKDIGAVTFKVIPVDPDSAPGSGGGGAAAGRLQPASPTTAEIKLLESEIFAVRHECAQHRVQNEARVRTLKSRLEGTVNFDAPHSSSEEAIVHLRSLHQELTHLELELSENRTDRVEKAERQTQEVLQLLEESKAEMARLRLAAEKSKRNLSAAAQTIEELTKQRDSALEKSKDTGAREEPETDPEADERVQSLRLEIRNVLRVREEDKLAHEQQLESATKTVADREKKLGNAQWQLIESERVRRELEEQVDTLQEKVGASEKSFNERLQRADADALRSTEEKDSRISTLEQQLASLRSECQAAAKKSAADAEAHRLELVAQSQKHADALGDLRASGEESGVQQLELLRARLEAELGVQVEHERSCNAAKQRQLDALSEQLEASEKEKSDILERIEMLDAALKESADAAACERTKAAEDMAALREAHSQQQMGLRTTFDGRVALAQRELSEAVNRENDSRAAADALQATMDSLQVKLDSHGAAMDRKEEELRLAAERAEKDKGSLREAAFKAQTEASQHERERRGLQDALDASTAEAAAQKALAEEKESALKKHVKRIRELESKLDDHAIGKAQARLQAAEDQLERLRREGEKQALEAQLQLKNLQLRYNKSEQDVKRLKEALALAEALSGGMYNTPLEQTQFMSMSEKYKRGLHPLESDKKRVSPIRRAIWYVAFGLIALVAFMAGTASVSGKSSQYITSLKHGYLAAVADLEQNHTVLVNNLQQERSALQMQLAKKQTETCDLDPFDMQGNSTLVEQLDACTMDLIAHRARAERLFAAEQATGAHLAAAEHQIQHSIPIEGGPRLQIAAGTNLDSKAYLVNPCHAKAVSTTSCHMRYLMVRGDGEITITAELPSKTLPLADEVVWSSGKSLRLGDRWPLLGKKRRSIVDDNHYELRLRRNGQLVVMDTETHRTLWRSTKENLPLKDYTASLTREGSLVVKKPDGEIVWKSHAY